MGIVLDSDRMEARLPPDKVQRLTSCFTEFKGRRSCTLKELQSLIGSLNFACKVIPPGRPFLQRMIQLTRNVSLPHHRIKLSKGFFKDLRMWEDFICNWNGAGLFLCLLIGSFQMSCLCTQMPLVLWDLGAFFKPTGFKAHKKPHKKKLGQPEISIAWQELFGFVIYWPIFSQTSAFSSSVTMNQCQYC